MGKYKILCHHCRKANEIGTNVCESCNLNLNTRPTDDLDDDEIDYYESGFMNDFGDN